MDANNNKTPEKLGTLTRKKRKPFMEKKRRARINASLEELKKLVLDATRKESARYSKLEKADILELTVKHLREVQTSSMTVAMHQDPTIAGRFRTGFSECMSEVSRYLQAVDGMSSDVHARLMMHLATFRQRMEISPMMHTALVQNPSLAQPGSFMMDTSDGKMYSPNDASPLSQTYSAYQNFDHGGTQANQVPVSCITLPADRSSLSPISDTSFSCPSENNQVSELSPRMCSPTPSCSASSHESFDAFTTPYRPTVAGSSEHTFYASLNTVPQQLPYSNCTTHLTLPPSSSSLPSPFTTTRPTPPQTLYLPKPQDVWRPW